MIRVIAAPCPDYYIRNVLRDRIFTATFVNQEFPILAREYEAYVKPVCYQRRLLIYPDFVILAIFAINKFRFS